MHLKLFSLILTLTVGSALNALAAAPRGGQSAGAAVTTWPAPKEEKLFPDYSLQVNGRAVPVYRCRVSAMPFNQVWPGYQRPLDQTEFAGFAYWEMSGPVTVEVTSSRSFHTVAVRPLSRGVQPVVHGSRITFELSRPGQWTVELDGTHHALHLFGNPPEGVAPHAGDPSVLYFGPGVHRPGKILLKDGQTIYVAGGAVVYTAIEGRGVHGIRILGRGIIDTSEIGRADGGGSIHLEDCADIKVEGVIIRDSNLYGLSAFGSRNLEVSNVKLIGFWRYNTDGMDMCNTQNVTIRDSFIRSFDDSVVIKGVNGHSGGARPLPGQSYDNRPVRNFRATGLVVWCDWGRALEIGAETSAPEITDVVFRDIDVIRNTHIALDIQHSDRAAIHGIRFEDVRAEVDDTNPLPEIQKGAGAKYEPDAPSPAGACGGCASPPPGAGYLPNLLVIVIHPTSITRDKEQGTVRDVVFKNISVVGKYLPPSAFTGFDAAHDVRGVAIEGLRFNGQLIKSLTDAHVEIRHDVHDVRLTESGIGQ